MSNFKAARAVAKIGSNVKPNHHNKVKLNQIIDILRRDDEVSYKLPIVQMSVKDIFGGFVLQMGFGENGLTSCE